MGTRSRTSFISICMAVCVSLLSMAANLPCLPGSPFSESLTSFVPPAHNQGVSLAPQQGHALWKVFLPTTGSSLYLVLLTPDSANQHLSADVSRLTPLLSSSSWKPVFLPVAGTRQLLLKLPGSGRKRFCWPFISVLCDRRSSDISHHL